MANDEALASDEEGKVSSREIQIYDPENPGELISRKAYCRREFAKGEKTRQEIAAELTVLEGQVDEDTGELLEVPYQIVYAATKDMEGAGGGRAAGGVRGAPVSAEELAKKAADFMAKKKKASSAKGDAEGDEGFDE